MIVLLIEWSCRPPPLACEVPKTEESRDGRGRV